MLSIYTKPAATYRNKCWVSTTYYKNVLAHTTFTLNSTAARSVFTTMQPRSAIVTNLLNLAQLSRRIVACRNRHTYRGKACSGVSAMSSSMLALASCNSIFPALAAASKLLIKQPPSPFSSASPPSCPGCCRPWHRACPSPTQTRERCPLMLYCRFDLPSLLQWPFYFSLLDR